MTRQTGDRVASEKEFHNKRFSESGTRQAQHKYYWAIKDGAKEYMDYVLENSVGADVLEYGCGDSSNYRRFSSKVNSYFAIDISDVAIRKLKQQDKFCNVNFQVMDGMNLEFDDGCFDLIYGSGIIHHLDTEKSAQEISRVLRTGGKAVFWEPLGLNPIINIYRALTPQARTPDENPLLPRDFLAFSKYFESVEVRYYGLVTLASIPWSRGGFGEYMFSALRFVDRILLSVPGIQKLAWYSLIICHK